MQWDGARAVGLAFGAGLIGLRLRATMKPVPFFCFGDGSMRLFPSRGTQKRTPR
jgi:hypothetical protein